MKKYLFYAGVLLAAAVSCVQEQIVDEEPIPEEEVVSSYEGTITLTASGEVTKASLNDSNSIIWMDGDQIGVRLYKGDAVVGTDPGSSYTATDEAFSLTDGANTTQGTFSYSGSLDQWMKWGYAAFYPKFDSNIGGDGKVYFHLQSYYENYVSGCILMPMLADLSGDPDGRPSTMTFKHVGAGIKVTIRNVPKLASQVSLTIPDHNIQGWYNVADPTKAGTDEGVLVPNDSNYEASRNTVYLQFDTATETREMTFIFPIPLIGQFNKIQLKLYTGGGGNYTEIWSKSAKASTIPALSRGQVLELPDLTPSFNLGAYNPDLANNQKASGITYQMNVYSFADSDGDGVGDFKGIQNHLDYLDKLGVTAIWLSPSQVAQSYHGYDITDYSHLNPLYGSGAHTSARAEADFQSLINAAHEHNIRIYMDYVINHTGDAHPWFRDVKQNGPSSPYWDYYAVSADPYNDVHNDLIPQIPTSWDVDPYTDGRWWPFVYGAGANQVRYAVDLDWTNASAPTLTVSETTEAVTSGGTYNNDPRYLMWGNGTYTQFADNGTNRYRLVLDFQSDWGCLVRTTDDNSDWGAGTKWGFASGKDQLQPGVSHALTDTDANNILMPDGTLYFYYSAFSTGMMPDLNYHHASDCENSPAFQAIVASIDKWLDMGLDGLRLDAIKHIYGDESGGEGSENRLFWQKFYSAVNAKYQAKSAARSNLIGTADPNIFMVGEVLSDESNCRPFYAGLPAIFEFQFWWDLRTALKNDSKGDFVSGLCDRYYRHQEVREGASQPGAAIPTPKLSNHDEDRTASELYDMHRIRQAAAVLLTAPGRPFIYQGEELGYWGTGAGGDEYRRAPILWTSDISSAATHGVNDKYDSSMLTPSISVASQAADDESLLTLYRRFAYARNTNPAMADGNPEYDNKTGDNSAIMAWYMHQNGGSKTCLVMHNISGYTQNVQRWDGDNVGDSTILVATDPINFSKENGNWVIMPPYSSVVFALN